MAVRVVIVDDEPLARERIRTLLAGRDDVVVIAECGDGEQAVATMLEHAPDLVFLDVQMPELDGFGVLEAIEPSRIPALVFVTAFDAYALRAFEVNALDYLLKPFDRARFERALARALDVIERDRAPGATSGDDEVRALLAYLRAGQRYAARFVVRSAKGLHFVRPEEIDWIDAAGNYVRLHVGGAVHLIRDTMRAVESRLDPNDFVRVHRSAIINIDRVRSLEPYFHGEYVVTLRTGEKVTSSRTHSARLRELLR